MTEVRGQVSEDGGQMTEDKLVKNKSESWNPIL